MSVPHLFGKRVELAPMRLEEADLLARWASQPGQAAFWFGGEVGRAEVLARWPPVCFDDAYPQKGRVFRVDQGGQPVGAVVQGAVWGTPRNALVDLLLDEAAPPELGADALGALAAYLHGTLAVQDVWGEVPPGDGRRLAAYEAAGFVRGGLGAEGRVVLRLGRAPRGRASPEPGAPEDPSLGPAPARLPGAGGRPGDRGDPASAKPK